MVFRRLRFMGVPRHNVDLDAIRAFIEDDKPKRINFASHHTDSLRKTEGKGNVIGSIVLPFDEPFESIAKQQLGIDRILFKSQYNDKYYRQIRSEDEFNKIKDFVDQYKDLVFLRDTLDLSVALSMHETEPEARTVLGEHEFKVKYRSEQFDTKADLDALLAEMQKRLEELPFFKQADYICAVPSSKPFMRDIIAGLNGFNFVDISGKVAWENKNGSLKNVETAGEKLDMIQSWGLKIDDKVDLNGKTVLLVDDMYQSGITLQYIAMRMKERGTDRVFGMALVKSLGN